MIINNLGDPVENKLFNRLDDCWELELEFTLNFGSI